MMTLADLFRSAQDGAALRNLASFYGLTPQQTEAAIDAFLPAFSQGLKQQVREPALFPGFAQMIGAEQGLAFFNAFTRPQDAIAQGQAIMAQLFGSPEATPAIAREAARMTGIGSDILREMLPAVASIIAGGIAKAAAEQGVKAYFEQFMPAPSRAPALPPAAAGHPWGPMGEAMAQAMTPPWLAAPTPPPREKELPELGVAALAKMFETGQQMQDRQIAAMRQVVDAFLGHRPPRNDEP